MEANETTGAKEEESGQSKPCDPVTEEAQPSRNSNVTVSRPAGSANMQNVITQMMDIGEPLSRLRTLLGPRLHCSLKEHEIHLQGASGLDPDKSLLEQGITSQGMVQFSVQINFEHEPKPVINIIDIMKPIIETVEVPYSQAQDVTPSEVRTTSKSMEITEEGQVTQVIVCNNYREEQEKNDIPLDPKEWTLKHTNHWLTWASSEFGLDPKLKLLKAFRFPGDQLCTLTREDFTTVLPSNAGDLFWTHLQVLIKTKDTEELTSASTGSSEAVVMVGTEQTTKPSKPARPTRLNSTSEDRILPGHRTGTSNQIQLWQFLLEMLTDWTSLDYITWVGDEGEFKLLDAEMVALKWGERKGKNSMNYEKLSRALRYYYDGDMIAKVHGKRYVYQFVCNLKELIGYNAAELKKLVSEAKEKNRTAATVIRFAKFT